MSHRPRSRRARCLFVVGASVALALFVVRCGVSPSRSPRGSAPSAKGAHAWQVVYDVLQHPRCVNCHPSGDAPLQGDASQPHAQNVQRGTDGQGVFALRCSDCHQEQNLAGMHMPPGAPHWQLPTSEVPMVFEGRTSAELCRQLQDPAQNGGRTLEQIYDHMAHDALVLWGWDPGDGRTPIATPHAEFLGALRTWIDEGCGCPTPR